MREFEQRNLDKTEGNFSEYAFVVRRCLSPKLNYHEEGAVVSVLSSMMMIIQPQQRIFLFLAFPYHIYAGSLQHVHFFH